MKAISASIIVLAAAILIVGGFFAPYQIKRIAKAEAEAAIIKAQTEIQITDLHVARISGFAGAGW